MGTGPRDHPSLGARELPFRNLGAPDFPNGQGPPQRPGSSGWTTPPLRAGELAHGSPKNDSSDASLSSLVAPDEVCWCPWCWRQNRDGEPENVVLGSFEKWRSHMHEQHFDKLGSCYGPDEVMPCYWCCRPCATEKGQLRQSNHLPFWGSHERNCRENPNKPALPSQQVRSSGSSSHISGGRQGNAFGGILGPTNESPPSSPENQQQRRRGHDGVRYSQDRAQPGQSKSWARERMTPPRTRRSPFDWSAGRARQRAVGGDLGDSRGLNDSRGIDDLRGLKDSPNDSVEPPTPPQGGGRRPDGGRLRGNAEAQRRAL